MNQEHHRKLYPLLGIVILSFFGCNNDEKITGSRKKDIASWNSLMVTATAYNSLPGQGKGNIHITAWGDTLQPGDYSIAVSRDLIKKGLTYGTEVVIEGLDNTYFVNDKMHSRWKNTIDIYMGENREKALNWGRRKVEICFQEEDHKQ